MLDDRTESAEEASAMSAGQVRVWMVEEFGGAAKPVGGSLRSAAAEAFGAGVLRPDASWHNASPCAWRR